MRRDVDMHGFAQGLGDGADEGDQRSLAVGTRDMDYRRQLALRMAKCREQALDASSDRSIDCGCSALRRSSSVRLSETEGSGMPAPSSLWARWSRRLALDASRRAGFGRVAEGLVQHVRRRRPRPRHPRSRVAAESRERRSRRWMRVHAVKVLGKAMSRPGLVW
jgi:hypothetical protein